MSRRYEFTDRKGKILPMRRTQNKKILIHTCCADCFLNAINYLKKNDLLHDEQKISAFFYNPNIHPKSEYTERMNALKKVLPDYVELIIPDYKPSEYLEAERNKTRSRCINCWDLRIKKLFEYAKEKGFDNVTTTLLTSHYQDADIIVALGNKYSKEYGINFIKISNECNCKNTGFYKQNYCGCCYSLVEKMNSKRKPE